MAMERRSFDFEMRAAKEKTIEGYAVVFEAMSERMWGFREKIRAGALADSLKSDRDVFALWNHNTDIPLASRATKTLRLEEDSRGLAFEMRTDDTTWGQFAYQKISDGTVRKMSFGFRTLTDEWQLVDGEEIRTVVTAELYEISPVLFPAYPQTSAEARSVLTPDEVWQQHLAHAGAAGTGDDKRTARFGIAEMLALAENHERSIQR